MSYDKNDRKEKPPDIGCPAEHVCQQVDHHSDNARGEAEREEPRVRKDVTEVANDVVQLEHTAQHLHDWIRILACAGRDDDESRGHRRLLAEGRDLRRHLAAKDEFVSERDEEHDEEDPHEFIEDPVEPPPQGDMELIDVRRQVGEQIVLFGNIEASELELLSPPAFEARVRQALCQGTAGPGRGFVLMPSACPYGRHIPEDVMTNYRTMVRLAKGFSG